MEKGKSKKPRKSRAVAPVSVAKRTKTVAPRGVRKHLRQLERQFSDAARQERKRLRKLERATFRRQMLQAALEELRGETIVVVVPPAVGSPADASATAPAKPLPAARRRHPAARARTTRAATATTKTATAATPVAKPGPTGARIRTTRTASPATRPSPTAVRTRTTKPATSAAKTAPPATPN